MAKAVVYPPRRQQCDELFGLIDSDKSGAIELKELKQMVQLINPGLSETAIAAQFTALDASKDGRVSREEFSKHFVDGFKSDDEKKYYERMQYTKRFLTRKPRLGAVFDTFDIEKAGFLSYGELVRMIRLSKPKFTNADLQTLFNKMDINHDNRVSRDEFIMYYFTLFFSETDGDFEDRIEEVFQGRRKVKLQMLFNMYDTDGNGTLDLSEFSRMLKLNGRKFVSADVILDTLIKVDKNKNRKIEFSEWVDYMGTLCAHLDDVYFNKAVNNMMDAAQPKTKNPAAPATAVTKK